MRRAAARRVNTLPDVDLERLADEIEDMGNNTLAKIEGIVAQILIHLLTLEYSPDPDPRRHRLVEIDEWRLTLDNRRARSPSALARVDLPRQMRHAVRILHRRCAGHPWIERLPAVCPYTVSQIVDPDFVPPNRHGLGGS